MTPLSGKLRAKDVRRRFDQAAANFDEANFVHRTTFDGLIDRMTPLVITPSVILDLGSATGTGSRMLAKQYRKARVLGLDRSGPMLRAAKGGRSRFSRIREVQGNATRLPLQTGSADLVFSNMLLPWIDDIPACFAEVGRVLRKGGVFAFATVGPDSLRNLREAWGESDDTDHVCRFADMHDVGDALVGSGLAEPVLDVDRLTVTYRDGDSLFSDLSATGARNSLVGRRTTLTGKRRFESMLDKLTGDGAITIEVELVYGHAWGTGPRTPAGELHVDPGSIGYFIRR